MRLGVLWDYPFALVRQLLIVFLCLLALTFAATWILTHPADPIEVLIHIVPVTLAILLSMYVAELVGVTVRPRPPLRVEALFWAIATSCIAMAVGYAIIPTYAPSTALVCAAPIVSALCVFLQRSWSEARGPASESMSAVLFAATRKDAARGMAELANAPGVHVKALILPESVENRSAMAGLLTYTPRQGQQWYRSAGIHLFAVASGSREDLEAILAPTAGAGCIVQRVEDLVAATQGRLALDRADDIAVMRMLSSQANRFAVQRLLDIFICTLFVPLWLVLFVLVAIAVKLTSRGPVFYHQLRVGRWGKPFRMFKFRTMRHDAEKETGPVWARENDPRVTAVGRFLRATRIDETPQIWNVIFGTMSLVGPRPERPNFVEDLRAQIPLYDARHSVRPGVSGWAQIRYRYGSDDRDAVSKLGYELFYILNRSLTFYFTVLLETVKVILFRRGGH